MLTVQKLKGGFIMRSLVSVSALILITLAAGFPTNAFGVEVVTPPANTTFSFSGACFDCDGTGTGTLVVQNYTPGTPLAPTNFFSWSYHSNLVNYSLGQGQETAFAGVLGSAPGPYTVTINGSPYDFSSFSGGSWCVSNTDCFAETSDFGAPHTWSMSVNSVAEPGSIGLLLAGVFGMGALRRRDSEVEAA
jgi:hypothetical protein